METPLTFTRLVKGTTMTTPKSDHAAIWQFILTLKKNGWKAIKITDPEFVVVTGDSPKAIADMITNNYDECILNFSNKEIQNGRTQWAYFVMGNSPEEVVCNYSVGIEEFAKLVDQITESWW